MKTSPLFDRAAPWLFAGACSLLGLAGCAGDPGPSVHRTAVAAATPPAAPIPEKEAHAVFFADQIEAEVLLGSGGFAPREVGRVGAAGRGGERSRGGFSAGGGGRRGGRGGGGGGSVDRNGDMPRARAGSGGEPTPNIRPSNAPPVQFHLRLTNHGSEPLDVEIIDFNSALGNFVVQPRQITIPAGASVEADPMISRLGINAAEIPLTIAIRANGKTEKQVLTLRPKSDPPPANPGVSTPPSSP